MHSSSGSSDVGRSGIGGGEWFEVTTEQQASWLSTPSKRRFLLPFLGRDCTIKAASAETGCTLEVMYYRVQQLQRAGLVRMVRQEARRGRAVKHYRTVADQFFVPYTRMALDSLEDEVRAQWQVPLRQLSRGIAGVMRQHAYEGQYLSRLPSGEVSYAGGPAAACVDLPGHPRLALDALGEVRLSREQAAAFRQGLIGLVRSFQATEKDAGDAYTFALMFAPRD